MKAYQDTLYTYVEINGYEYELEVSFSIYDVDDVELYDIKIKNDQKEWVDFPYLERVEEDLIEEVLEYASECMQIAEEQRAEQLFEAKRDKELGL